MNTPTRQPRPFHRAAWVTAALIGLPLAAALRLNACGTNAFAPKDVPKDTTGTTDTTVKVKPTTGKDTTPPTVSARFTTVVAPGASIGVTASDPRGVKVLGLLQFRTKGELLANDSVVRTTPFSTTSTAQFPVAIQTVGIGQKIVLMAYARDSAGNLAYRTANADRRDSSLAKHDSVERGVGRSATLGEGTVIAQIMYHPRRNELYVINRGLNRLEKIDIATATRTNAYSTGTQPIQGAFVPRTSSGVLSDSLVIANFGSAFLNVFTLATTTITTSSVVPIFEARVITQRRTIDITGKITLEQAIDRSSSTGDRATGLAILCLTATPGPCTRTMAYVGTGGSAQTDSDVTLIRTIPLSGPGIGQQSVLLEHIADAPGADVQLATISLANPGSDVLFRQYTDYPTLPRGLFGGRWALTNSVDGRTAVGVNRVDIATGRAFSSQKQNSVASVLSTADIASNIGGKVVSVSASPWGGTDTRFAIHTTKELSFVDTILRLRGSVDLPRGGFAFVDPNNLADPTSTRWAVISSIGTQPSLTIATTALDGLRPLFTVRTSVELHDPMTAWLNNGGDTLWVVGSNKDAVVTAAIPLNELGASTSRMLGPSAVARFNTARATLLRSTHVAPIRR